MKGQRGPSRKVILSIIFLGVAGVSFSAIPLAGRIAASISVWLLLLLFVVLTIVGALRRSPLLLTVAAGVSLTAILLATTDRGGPLPARPPLGGWVRLTVGRRRAWAITALAVHGNTATITLGDFSGIPSMGALPGSRVRTVQLHWPNAAVRIVSARVPAPPTPSVRLSWPNNGWQTPEGSTRPVLETNSKKPTVLPVQWPRNVPTYWSGAHPVGPNPYILDNRVLGQVGDWLIVAMQGPKTPPAPLGLGWGFRTWDRILVLNRKTGSYRLYRLPPRGSFRLGSAAPVLASANQEAWIGIGRWLGRIPLPPSATPLPVIGTGTPPSLQKARWQEIQAYLHRFTWQNIDGAAAFWNCDVMQDPAKAACPAGSAEGNWGYAFNGAYLNHGDLPPGLLWALSYPYTPAEQPAARRELRLALASITEEVPYAYAWFIYPSSASLRGHFHGTPPVHLPGYVRRNGYYWAVAP